MLEIVAYERVTEDMDNEFEKETHKDALNIIIVLPHYVIPRDLGTEEGLLLGCTQVKQRSYIHMRNRERDTQVVVVVGCSLVCKFKVSR